MTPGIMLDDVMRTANNKRMCFLTWKYLHLDALKIIITEQNKGFDIYFTCEIHTKQ